MCEREERVSDVLDVLGEERCDGVEVRPEGFRFRAHEVVGFGAEVHVRRFGEVGGDVQDEFDQVWW